MTSLLELGVVHEAGDVGAGARGAWRGLVAIGDFVTSSRTEGSWGTDDHGLVLDLLGQIDLVAGGVLDQDVQVGNGIALLHERGRGAVEEGSLRANAGKVGGEAAGGEHFGIGLGVWWNNLSVEKGCRLGR